MNFIDSYTHLKKKAAAKQGQQLTAFMRANVEAWKKDFHDDPSVESGWGHAYFCSQCGTYLKFNLETPHEHRCPCCGKVEVGPVYDASWVYLYRYDAIMSALNAAVLYVLEKKEEDLAYFMKVVGFYSENWYRFCEHGRNTWPSGNGKITPQALNEAIFLVKLTSGLELVKQDLPEAFLENVKKWFLIPCAYFLDVQKRKIHNIPCWLNAAVGTAGLFCGNQDLIERAFTRQYGLADQVRGGGVTASYFWYEGSIHYNFFTLEAFMNSLLFAGVYRQEIPEDVQETVYQMLLAPCKYAFSNGQLPNPNDGWPNLGLKTYSFIYEMGAKIFEKRPGTEIPTLAANIRCMEYDRVPVPLSYPTYAGNTSLEWLLFAPEVENAEQSEHFTTSHVFEASNFATLKTPNLEVFHKFGHCTPSHAHPDKMTVEIRAFGQRITHDLSNCGYAARLCPEFHRTSAAHNTVIRDGENHPTTDPGKVLEQSASMIHSLAPEAYPGTDFERQLSLSGGEEPVYEDIFTVRTKDDTQHTWDWVFHVDGTLTELPEWEESTLGYTGNGYAYLSDVREVKAEGEIVLYWKFAGGVCGEQKIVLNNQKLFVTVSPDNPPKAGRERTTLVIRSCGKDAEIRQNWKFRKEQE